MKTLIALLAAAAFVAPAFAADAPPVPMTKADCDKTLDMKWDATTKACLQSSRPAAPATARAVRTAAKPRIALRAMRRLTVHLARAAAVRLARTQARLRAARLIGHPASKRNSKRRISLLLLKARGSRLSRALFQVARAQSPSPCFLEHGNAQPSGVEGWARALTRWCKVEGPAPPGDVSVGRGRTTGRHTVR